MTLFATLLLGLVCGATMCEGSFSVLSEPRETCAGYQGIADSISDLTAEVEAKIPTVDPLLGVSTTLQNLLNSLTVYPSCDVVTGASGLYRIMQGSSVPLQYYCQTDLLGGGWTVIQRRTSGTTNFTRSFAEYRDGFGHPSAEFWLGLNRINLITQSGQTELAIVMEAFDGTNTTVRYTNFVVGDASTNYRLTTLSGFSGPVGNSLSTGVGMTFSTFDKDLDTSPAVNCANVWGGGWWMSNCGDSNLNGFYRGATPTATAKTSMNWAAYKPATQSLKTSIMLIRKYRP